MGPIEYDPYVDQEDFAHVDACEEIAEKISEMTPEFAFWLSENLNPVHDMWASVFDSGMKHEAFLQAERQSGSY